jgi:glycosyltransferase involved in cell wall biosynthesis
MSRLLHRAATTLWRHTPAGVRQKAAHTVIGRFAPRLSQVPRAVLRDRSVPRILVGMLSSPSGLGQSVRLAAGALRNDGYRVLGVDIGRFFHEVAGNIAHGLPDGSGWRGPAHVVLVLGAPYAPYALASLGSGFLPDKWVTGYWAWELPRLPRSWERGFGAVHDIAVPSLFTANAVAERAGGRPALVCPHPVALDHPPLSPYALGTARPRQPFTVVSTLSVGSGLERKNPVGLIRAFRLAFGDARDCRLRLLVTGAEHYPPARAAILGAIGRARNIEVAWQPLTRADFFAWWGTPDAYALLHRSEGFGLPLAEAMCAGVPVVATGWSGNMDYMSEQNSLPVRFQLVGVADPQRKYAGTEGQWAEPDIEHAAELMRMLAHRPDLGREIGATAHRAMRVRLTGQSFCRNLLGVDHGSEGVDRIVAQGEVRHRRLHGDA